MTKAGRPLLGLVLAATAAVGIVAATYLLISESGGSEAVCVIGGGCAEVASSRYSHVLGIPVSAFGIAWSTVALFAALAWWWSGDRRPLSTLYVGGLVAVVVEAYLVYLQLFVIEAVCSWCAVYGATVVLGWLGAFVAVARSARVSPSPSSEQPSRWI